jgi:hypothetical protein
MVETVVATGEDTVAYINGVRKVLPPASAEKTLLQYLRGATGRDIAFGQRRLGLLVAFYHCIYLL